jgi:4-carboxymuconolactone decarboxylase
MLDNLDERRARGHQVLREMFGDKWQQAYAAAIAGTGFGAEAGRMALEFAFAETWARPGLDRRSRSLVVIGALIAQGKPDELKNHIRAGLNNGITVEELELVILQTIPYCGFPAASQALEAAAFVLKERGLTVETAKDRGNL